MAQINFNEINQTNKANTSNNPGYFSLKNDKDEAVVRILADSVADFDIVTVHEANVNGKTRYVNCVRGPMDPSEACPFCEAGEKLKQVFFIHLIHYTTDENNKIVPVAKVWQRSTYYANIIRDLIMEYGPLSDVILKIRRNGVAGSKDTNYTILPANPAIYKAENYPKVDLFGDYKVIGKMVLNKSKNEMAYYIDNGEFPSVNVQATPKEEAIDTNEEINTSYKGVGYDKVPANETTVGYNRNVTNNVPWNQPNAVAQPRRSY